MAGAEGERGARAADDVGPLRVPRLLRAAEVLGADGRRLRGRVFIPATAEGHPGAMRADEWLNDRGDFFPFLPDGEGSPILLNKSETVVVTVPASSDLDGTLDEVPAPVRRVIVECGTVRIEGEVVIDMPVQHSRLLDLLNRDRAFLTVRDGERHHLVRRSRISRVREAPQGGGES